MAILVIGNGFDIAHGLPTKYSQFLDFLKAFKSEEECQDMALAKLVKKIKEEKKEIAAQIGELLFHDNRLLNHFFQTYTDRCIEGKDGWIDFEAEISEIIRNLDAARSDQIAKKRFLSKELKDKLLPIILTKQDAKSSDVPVHLSSLFIEMSSIALLNDLNELTRLLEIYLSEVVDQICVEKRIPEIDRLRDITSVLSFNYTDTYGRLYGNSKTKYCFIHGKAKSDNSLENCNLVLGIDEYLTGGRENTDNAFIWFKKFYQRIFKETSSSYIDWIDINEKVNGIERSKPVILDVYYYGHSLNVTDKDVLQKLICYQNAKSHIFYYNKTDLSTKISNLVKIIGEENLIRKTRGNNKTIEFIKTES